MSLGNQCDQLLLLCLAFLLSYSSFLKCNILHIFITLNGPLNNHVNSTYFFRLKSTVDSSVKCFLIP